MKNTLLIIVFCFFSLLSTQAQDDTKTTNKAELRSKYEQATKAYQTGDMEQCIVVLEEIIYNQRLMNIANKQLKADIMRLAAMTALYQKRTDLADKYVKQILIYQPSYKIDNVNSDDLLAIKAKLDKLYAVPKYSIGAGVGTSTSFIAESATGNVLMEHNQAANYKYINTFGAISLFAAFNYTLLPSITLSTRFCYSQNSYKYILPVISSDRNDTAFQKLKYLKLPLLVKLNLFPSKNITPYLQAGVAFKYLIGAERLVNDTQSPMNDYYKKFDIGFILGAGAKYHITKRTALNLDIMYYNGGKDINNSTNRFLAGPAGDEFLFRYYDVIDNIKLNSISVSVCLLYAINHKVFKKRR